MSGNKFDRDDMNYSHEDDSLKMKDFMTGAVIGGFVGAAVALFLAPKAGKDLRVNLNEQALVLKDKTNRLRETAVNKGTEIAEAAKVKVNRFSQSQFEGDLSEDHTADELKSRSEDSETQYIPLNENNSKGAASFDDLTLGDEKEVRRKLDEAKQALDEEESKVKQ